MVKPFYIVFFFFALSLCDPECVMLTKQENGSFTCKKEEKQSSAVAQAPSTIDICNVLGLENNTDGNLSIKNLLTAITNNDNSKGKLEFSYPNASSGENSETLEICYKAPEKEEEQELQKEEESQHEGESQSEQKQERMLKIEGTNPLSNILPSDSMGQNRNTKIL